VDLSNTEKKVRKLLIRVAMQKRVGHRVGRISYKEVWLHIHKDGAWGQSYTREVVEWITRISAFELLSGRPPLNELVTPVHKLVPKDEWGSAAHGIKAHLQGLSGIAAPYKDHEEAQAACWKYWADHSEDGDSIVGRVLSDKQVEEGYRGDRQVQFIKRNKKIILDAKKRDGFRCQACGFHLEVEGKALIDCHHRFPLSHSPGARITRLDDLVCLCPTCHRIAHTKAFPLSPVEIRQQLKKAQPSVPVKPIKGVK